MNREQVSLLLTKYVNHSIRSWEYRDSTTTHGFLYGNGNEVFQIQHNTHCTYAISHQPSRHHQLSTTVLSIHADWYQTCMSWSGNSSNQDAAASQCLLTILEASQSAPTHGLHNQTACCKATCKTPGRDCQHHHAACRRLPLWHAAGIRSL